MDSLHELLRGIEQITGLRLKNNQISQVQTSLLALSLERHEETGQSLAWLMSNQSELERFAATFTIPETHFHRIVPQMTALKKRILPSLFASRQAGRKWKFWSAGCSSGEEAYTLAILALEFLEAQPWTFGVLGTDLNQNILEKAKAALYSEWSFRDTPAQWRERYFAAQQDLWSVLPQVRQHVRFERLNLMSETWGAADDFDLILCRNVTIYFSNRSAQKIYERLAARLSLGGWLVLGPSDPPPIRQTLERAQLQPIFEDGAIIWQKVTQAELAPHLAKVPWFEGDAFVIPSPTPAKAPRPPTLENLPRLPTLESVPRRPTLESVPRRPTLESVPRRPTLENLPQNATIELPANFAIPHPSAPMSQAPTKINSQHSQTLEGMNLLEQGKPEEALVALRRAAYLEPNDPVTQFALARANQMVGDHKRARSALRQARRLLAGLPEDALLSLETSVSDLHRALSALSNQLKP
jgi:chemotaxis protein methyltransferase CheR